MGRLHAWCRGGLGGGGAPPATSITPPRRVSATRGALHTGCQPRRGPSIQGVSLAGAHPYRVSVLPGPLHTGCRSCRGPSIQRVPSCGRCPFVGVGRCSLRAFSTPFGRNPRALARLLISRSLFLYFKIRSVIKFHSWFRGKLGQVFVTRPCRRPFEGQRALYRPFSARAETPPPYMPLASLPRKKSVRPRPSKRFISSVPKKLSVRPCSCLSWARLTLLLLRFFSVFQSVFSSICQWASAGKKNTHREKNRV